MPARNGQNSDTLGIRAMQRNHDLAICILVEQLNLNINVAGSHLVVRV